jgi:hypothetical protein
MGKFIKQIDIDVLKESYKTQSGHYPTWLGEVFGWSGQQTIYNIFEQLAEFTDELVPEILVIGMIDDVLIQIYQAAYNVLAHFAYWDWAYRGDDLAKTFDSIIADYQSKVNQAVQDAKNLVEREFISPLRNQTAALQTQIASATAQLGNLNRMIDDAKKTLSNHGVRIQDLESKTNSQGSSLESVMKQISDKVWVMR